MNGQWQRIKKLLLKESWSYKEIANALLGIAALLLVFNLLCGIQTRAFDIADANAATHQIPYTTFAPRTVAITGRESADYMWSGPAFYFEFRTSDGTEGECLVDQWTFSHRNIGDRIRVQLDEGSYRWQWLSNVD